MATVEYVALDLLMDEDGACRGMLAWNMEDGTLNRFRAPRLPRWYANGMLPGRGCRGMMRSLTV
jgi:hypothetical protein